MLSGHSGLPAARILTGLDEMEKEPGKDYKQIKTTIITAIISTVVTTAVGAIIAAMALL